MPLEKLKLTEEEVADLSSIGVEMFKALDQLGAIGGDDGVMDPGLRMCWFNQEGLPSLTELFHMAERIHWPDPDLPSLMRGYEINTDYLVIVDKDAQTALHGFRMCLPKKVQANQTSGLVGLPVVDDLILGAHTVNGYTGRVTVDSLSKYYRGIVLPDRPSGIEFPESAVTIESNFRINKTGLDYTMPISLYGYVGVAKHAQDTGGRVLMTYLNEAAMSSLAQYGISFSNIQGEAGIPPVDRREDGSIVGRLDGYRPVAILWDEINRALLEAVFPALPPVHTAIL